MLNRLLDVFKSFQRPPKLIITGSRASLSEGGQSMEEMSEQDRQARDAKLARRKRIVVGVARAVGLVAVSFWLLVFLIVLRTGYLSRIGIAVGLLYLMPGLAAPLVGFAGKRRLEAFLSWLHTGQPLLVALVVGLVSVWP
jgi:hypothetical protein